MTRLNLQKNSQRYELKMRCDWQIATPRRFMHKALAGVRHDLLFAELRYISTRVRPAGSRAQHNGSLIYVLSPGS